jgi:nucleotide-binding universal stress UspA family protein
VIKRKGEEMEKILVPVDGSEQSHKAVAFAAGLAKCYNATMYLIHVFKLTIIPEGLGEYVVSDRAQLQALADTIIAGAVAEAKGQGVEHVEAAVIEGDPAERIIDYAKAHDVDIIVIGSRGLGTFKGLLLGSVSNKVSHRADRSCVIVR